MALDPAMPCLFIETAKIYGLRSKKSEAKERLMGYFFKPCFTIEEDLIYKVVLVSGAQKSDSDAHTQIYARASPVAQW